MWNKYPFTGTCLCCSSQGPDRTRIDVIAPNGLVVAQYFMCKTCVETDPAKPSTAMVRRA